MNKNDILQIFGGVLLGGLLTAGTTLLNSHLSYNRDVEKSRLDALRDAYANWFHAMNSGFRATKTFDDALLNSLDKDLVAFNYLTILKSNKPGTFAQYDHKSIRKGIDGAQSAAAVQVQQETLKVREALFLASSAYTRLLIMESNPEYRKIIRELYLKIEATPIEEPLHEEQSVKGMIDKNAYLEKSITDHIILMDKYHQELLQFSEYVVNNRKL